MDWPQVLTIVGANIALISITIGLFTHLDNKSERRFEEGRKETNAILKAIQEEMKDFHGRLCAIEERAKVTHKS